MTNTTSEADMGYVKDFVSKIAEALVAATELPKQMEAIKAEMTTLASNLDHTKAENVRLDTMLADTRRQRDEAEQALSSIKGELTQIKHENEVLNNKAERDGTVLDGLRSQLEQAKKDRDDAAYRHLEADERATLAEAKLKKLREALGMVEAPSGEAAKPMTPDTPPPPQPEPYAPEINPTQSPPPVQVAGEPRKVYYGDIGYVVSKPDVGFDPEKSQWYQYA